MTADYGKSIHGFVPLRSCTDISRMAAGYRGFMHVFVPRRQSDSHRLWAIHARICFLYIHVDFYLLARLYILNTPP